MELCLKHYVELLNLSLFSRGESCHIGLWLSHKTAHRNTEVKFKAGADMKRISSLQTGNPYFESMATVVQVLPK